MRGALGGPRVLLRRLREVMAEPVSAQERLDKIVVLIAANMVAEVCSVYVLRVDGTLELYATEGLNREAVHQTVLRLGRRPGRPGRERGQADQPVRRPEPPGLLLPAGNRRRNLPLLPRRAGAARRQHARRAGGAEPRAAHLFRGGRGGAADHRHGAGRDDRLGRAVGARAARAPEPAARRPVQLDGAALADGIALGHVVLHEPRVVVTNFIADDVPKELQAARSRASRRCAPISTCCSSAATSPTAASTATCSKPTACSPTTAAGCTGCDEAVLTGLTAEAAVERVQSDTRARMLRADRPLSARAAARPRRPRQPADAPAASGATTRRRASSCRRTPILVARSMGPAALLDYDRKRLRGLVLEEGGPTSHVAIVARALGIPAVGEIANATGIVDPGDADHRRRRDRRRACAAAPDMEAAYIERVRLRARRQAQYLGAARPAVRHQGRRADHAAAQCRACRRPAAHRRDRRRRHRPVPHRAAVHGGGDVPAHRPSSSRSTARCSTPPATSR